jgi:hypothetical protein
MAHTPVVKRRERRKLKRRLAFCVRLARYLLTEESQISYLSQCCRKLNKMLSENRFIMALPSVGSGEKMGLANREHRLGYKLVQLRWP